MDALAVGIGVLKRYYINIIEYQKMHPIFGSYRIRISRNDYDRLENNIAHADFKVLKARGIKITAWDYSDLT